MKIIYLTEVDLSSNKGDGINERGFISALAQGSLEYIVIAPTPRNEFDARNIKVKWCGVLNRRSPVSYISYVNKAYKTIMQVYKKNNEWVIVARLGAIPILECKIIRQFENRFFIRLLTPPTNYTATKTKVSRAYGVIRKYLVTYIVNKASYADTPSFAYLNHAKEVYGIDAMIIDVLPNGYSSKDFKSAASGDNQTRTDKIFRIGYFGALAKQRSLERLVETGQFLDDGIEIQIYGQGPLGEHLTSCISKENLTNVKMMGMIPYDEVPAKLTEMDLGVDLSKIVLRLPSGEVHGSFSQKIPQYLSVGLPVLAYNVPDTEFVGRNELGKLVAIDANAEEIAACINEARHSLSKGGDISAKCRRFASQNLTYDVIHAEREERWLLAYVKR